MDAERKPEKIMNFFLNLNFILVGVVTTLLILGLSGEFNSGFIGFFTSVLFFWAFSITILVPSLVLWTLVVVIYFTKNEKHITKKTKKIKINNKKIIKNKDLREWINTSVAVIGLIVIILGVGQIHEMNVNLNEIKAELVTADKINANQISVNELQNVTNITFNSGGTITSTK